MFARINNYWRSGLFLRRSCHPAPLHQKLCLKSSSLSSLCELMNQHGCNSAPSRRWMHSHNRHVFALHYNELNELISGSEPNEVVGIADSALLKRMTTILRFKPGDQFVLFDLNSTYQLFKVVQIDKRMIKAIKLQHDQDEELLTLLNQRKKFTITASICMTKSKDTFEEMIYQCRLV